MRNCTATETQKYIVDKYGFNCQVGGFCRVIPPSTYYCECLPGWVGQLCNEPDFFPSRGDALAMTSVYLPLVGIVLLLAVVCAVLLVYFSVRQRSSVQASGGGSGGGSVSRQTC